eukprot:gene8184-804_t
MEGITVLPLGAGQDVGRSCIIIEMNGRTIMFDCGMHMGYSDNRRFPDFSLLAEGDLTSRIDVAIISHFHLDHCGALPYFSEMCGYEGPIIMTYPTKAICPILLEDYRKISVERKGTKNFFTSRMIKDCMSKVQPVDLHQTITIDKAIEIKAYYAGHVLGAAMFHVRVGDKSVVYTGDYNMTPDRHLGTAWIDYCKPDAIITESTYATTIRDSKRCRERDFLTKVHRCVQNGGKVLIPVFALGRAQELCILLETYWERYNLKVPIFFSTGLTEKANEYYRLFVMYTNQKIKDTFVERNMFDFKHIRPFERAYADIPGPQVLFATPGMLHAGIALEVFSKWAGSQRNMVILPGYCVSGTVGAQVIAGKKEILIGQKMVHVRLQVQHLSFSAHADAKGIMTLIKQSGAKNVILVHGEKAKMEFLADRIRRELHTPCFFPKNGERLHIGSNPPLPVEISNELLHHDLHPKFSEKSRTAVNLPQDIEHDVPFSGVLARDRRDVLKVVTYKEARLYGVDVHTVAFHRSLKMPDVSMTDLESALQSWCEKNDVCLQRIGSTAFRINDTTIQCIDRRCVISATQKERHMIRELRGIILNADGS